ncbi:hypothetical protein PMIN06_012225 [Paraphaeosphaeria minitans]
MARKKYKTLKEQEDARREQNRRAQRAYRENRKCQGNTTLSIGTNNPRAKKQTKRRPVEQASTDVRRLESGGRLLARLSARPMPEEGDVESTARIPQSTTDPSVRTNNHVVRQASNDVGRLGRGRRLLARPSARPMPEEGDVESTARIPQSTTDLSVRTNSHVARQASNDVGRLGRGWRLPEDPSERLMLELQLTRIEKDVENIARISKSTTDRSVSEYMKEQGPCIQRVIDKLQALQEDRSEPAEAPVGDDGSQSRQHPAPACSHMLPLNDLLNPV